MIVDSSALLAVLLDEEEAERFAKAIAGTPRAAIGAPTLVETSIVIQSRGNQETQSRLASFMAERLLSIISFTEQHATAARDAYQRYCKGVHPARLNFGDCMAYAVARVEGRPLLFKGDDFARTDIEPALRG